MGNVYLEGKIKEIWLDDFNEDRINVYFNVNKDGWVVPDCYATLSIASHTFNIVDESFSHAFGVEKAWSYEFEANLFLTYLDADGEECKISPELLEELKSKVMEEMQEQDTQEMYELYN